MLTLILLTVTFTHDVEQVAIAIRGDSLASASPDAVTLWDLKTGEKQATIATTGVTDVCWAGKWLVTTSPDETRVYDGERLKDVLPGGAMCTANSTLLCVKDVGENLYTFEIGTFAQQKRWQARQGFFRTPIGMHAGDKVLAVGYKEGGMKFKTLATGGAFGTEFTRGVKLMHYTTNGKTHVVGDATGTYTIEDRDLEKIAGPGFPLMGLKGLVVFGKDIDYLNLEFKFVKRTPGVGEVRDAAWWGDKPVVVVGKEVKVLD